MTAHSGLSALGTNGIAEILRSFLAVMPAADPETPKRAVTRFFPIARKVGAALAQLHRDRSNPKPSYEPDLSPITGGRLPARGARSESEQSAPEHDLGAPPLGGDSKTCLVLRPAVDRRGETSESLHSATPEQ